MTPSYIPSPDPDFLQWLDNFHMKFAEHAARFGLADEVPGITRDFTWFQYTLSQVDCFKTDTSERITYKNTLRDGPLGEVAAPFPRLVVTPPPDIPLSAPGIEPRIRALVQRIKNHPAYTESIGEDLGIIARPIEPDTTPKPRAEARALANSHVRVQFGKGMYPAVVIESSRGNEPEFGSLGVKLRSPWVDARAPLVAGQPELRRYRVRFVVDDQPIGDYSDVVTVTTMP